MSRLQVLFIGASLALPLFVQVARAGEPRTECATGPLPQPNPDYVWPQEQESTMGMRR